MTQTANNQPPEAKPAAPHIVPDPVAQNIETIARIHSRTEEQISRHQRAIESVTDSLGRPIFLYGILLVVAAWAALNTGLLKIGVRPVDPPPFYWLQGTISLSALLMTTMVLITQNRQGKRDERRAHLEMQVNLLTEQKVTKLIALVEELRRDLPMVKNRLDPEADALAEAADPDAVLVAIEETFAENSAAAGNAKSD